MDFIKGTIARCFRRVYRYSIAKPGPVPRLPLPLNAAPHARGARAPVWQLAALFLSLAMLAPLAQAQACVYTMSPTSASFSYGAASGSFNISIPNHCITTGQIIMEINRVGTAITNGMNQGNGRYLFLGNSATVNYTVPAHGNLSPVITTISRVGGGPTFTITQAGAPPTPCVFVMNPKSANIPAAGGNGSFTIAAQIQNGCDPGFEIIVKVSHGWIRITNGANLGGGRYQWFGSSATVNYAVNPNPYPTADSGTITREGGGPTFTVNQAGTTAGCVYTMNPTGASFPAAGGSGSFTVALQSQNTCNPTGEIILKIDDPWIQITNGFDLGGGRYQWIGNTATVSYTVAANPNPNADVGTITKEGGGPTFTVNQAGTATPTAAVTVVEYYHAALDHYFITWIPAEIALLDAGTQIKGWVRTGLSFKTLTAPQAGTSPVCRYYIPPNLGDSHFFGRGTVECDATGQKNPTFVLEDSQFMNMFLPVAGVCPANTTPVHRAFSNRPDANHRYMTDKAVRDQMVARRWLAEGDGPDLVVMCAPQ